MLKKIEKQVNDLKTLAKAEFEKLHLLEEKTAKRKEHSSLFNIKGTTELFNFLSNGEVYGLLATWRWYSRKFSLL